MESNSKDTFTSPMSTNTDAVTAHTLTGGVSNTRSLHSAADSGADNSFMNGGTRMLSTVGVSGIV